MQTVTYQMLDEAVHPGGASALSDVTTLGLAGGCQSLVAPAKYLSGKRPTYVFERRFVDGETVNTVLIDSRTSEANRLEDAIAKGINDGQRTLSKMPLIRVTYNEGTPGERSETDLQLPHRAFDAHIRLGFDPSNPDHSTRHSILENETYQSIRNSTPASARAVVDHAPIIAVFGAWDSTRKNCQARFAASVTGEIIGVLSDQESKPDDTVTRRSGARIDPFGASFKTFPGEEGKAILKRAGLSKSGKGDLKGSDLLLGAIPPITGKADTEKDPIDGISVRKIIRSRVLSFSALRSLGFGSTPEGDRAIRSLLAAVAIDAMTRADAELNLRANAHLVEKEAPSITLFERFGKTSAVSPMEIEEADALLDEAYEKARDAAGLDWNGQVIEVTGDPDIIKNAVDTEDGE